MTGGLRDFQIAVFLNLQLAVDRNRNIPVLFSSSFHGNTVVFTSAAIELDSPTAQDVLAWYAGELGL